jgi:hypothetical protein
MIVIIVVTLATPGMYVHYIYIQSKHTSLSQYCSHYSSLTTKWRVAAHPGTCQFSGSPFSDSPTSVGWTGVDLDEPVGGREYSHSSRYLRSSLPLAMNGNQSETKDPVESPERTVDREDSYSILSGRTTWSSCRVHSRWCH